MDNTLTKDSSIVTYNEKWIDYNYRRSGQWARADKPAVATRFQHGKMLTKKFDDNCDKFVVNYFKVKPQKSK